jgi:hypothetical protein
MSKEPERQAHTFFVETRFQRMARRPGGVPRDAALEQAQANIEDSKLEFEAWLDAELRELANVVRNAQAGSAAPGWFEDIRSRSRQMGDLGTTMGFVLLTFIANNLCEILEGTQAGDEYNMETITCHLDALLLARQKQYREMPLEQLPELIKGLRLVAQSASIGSEVALK